MKKLKNFYQNNRIYCILMIISLVCFIAIGTGLVGYFLSQAASDNYGNRLDGIKEYKVDEDLKKMEEYFKSQEKVKEVNVRLQGKIIYIDFTVDEKLKNDAIETIATESLENITEENRSYYDIQFIAKRDNLAAYMGSKSASNTIISWTRYTYDTESESEEKKS